jgi:hypothetical protein
MPIKKDTREALRKLAEAMVQEPDRDADLIGEDLTRGFREGALPARLQRIAADGETLIMVGEDYRLYKQALHRVSAEKEMEHLTARDFVDRRRYRKDKVRAQSIQDFLTRIQKPWQEYEVMAVIHDLDLKVRLLEIAGVRLRTLSPQAALDWGLRGSPLVEQFAEDLVGKTIAVAEAEAGSARRAAEKARPKIDDALHTLRFALAGSILANIPDVNMLFRRGESVAVKARSTARVELIGWQREFKPIGFEIRRHTAEPVRRYLQPINAVIEGQTPDKLRSRLLRALHWIGTSVTHESPDYKVIDLCTALETLLTLKSDPRKAEAIALRSILLPAALGEAFLDPIPVYHLYELRSKIVHGSELRVCGEREYAHLRWITTTMVIHFVKLLARNTSITTHPKVIAAIETPDLFSQAIAWLESHPHPTARCIATFARKRLEAAQRQPN